MGVTIKQFLLSVCLLAAMNVNIEAYFTEFDLFVLSRSIDFKNAVDLCRKHGMNLVKIEDDFTNQMVCNYASINNLGLYWIDGIRGTDGVQWVYNNGSRMTYNKWYPGQPDNCNKEDCAHGLIFTNGFWNDADCNKTYTAICFFEKSTEDIVKFNESELVVLEQKANFTTAINLCRQKGMKLINIQNEEINKAVYGFALKNGLGEYWIDANDMATDGLWVNSDGNRIVYNKWYPGQHFNDENCAQGLYHNSGYWNDARCNVTITVICYPDKSKPKIVAIEESQLVVLQEKADYKTAVGLCKQRQMSLIKVQNDETNQVVYNYAVQKNLGEYWIDASDMETEGSWVYSDGNPIVYNKWQTGQPDNCNNEDCVHGFFYKNGTWNDVNCNKTSTVICYTEKKAKDMVTIDENLLVALGEMTDYRTALGLCKRRGMNLIKVQNEETNQAVYDYAFSNLFGPYWIDANDIKTEGSWVYSDGNPIIYNKWYPGQPNNVTTRNCVKGLRYAYGFWEDADCTSPSVVICYSEKKTEEIVTIEGNQLMAFGEKGDFRTAVNLCKKYGMNLIKIQDKETNQAIYEYAVNRKLGEYWIDANDMRKEGYFVYNDGSSIIYDKWYPGQPNRDVTRDCVLGLFHKNGFWKNEHCNRTSAIICYAEKPTGNIVTIEKNQLVGFRKRGDYKTAINFCKENDMNLIKVQNNETNQAVYEFAVENRLGPYWIDANDITTEGMWVYSDGNRIIYNKWASEEPNNLGIENCAMGLYYPSGFWNDIACNSTYSIICYGKLGLGNFRPLNGTR